MAGASNRGPRTSTPLTRTTLKSRARTAATRRHAQQLALRWIQDKWPRLVFGRMALEAGRLERSFPGGGLIVSTANEGASWMAEINAVARDSRQWHTRVLLAEGRDVDILAIQAGCMHTGSAPAAVAPPKLLAAWSEALDAHDASEPALGKPWCVTDKAEAAGLLEHLLSTQRALPVITLANKGESSHYGVDPEALATAMQGMAHVVCVTQQARAVLTSRLGAWLAPVPGAARIYGAGLVRDDLPESHPLVRQPDRTDSGPTPCQQTSFRQRVIRSVCATSARTAAGARL